jgi:3-methyladenine DNA glycosylase/8-oxoguanine DNA glycosylase
MIINNLNTFLKGQDGNYLQKIENIHNLKKHVTGIGDWTIDNALLISFQDEDIFPVGDYFLRKRIQKLNGLSKIPTMKETDNLTKRYAPCRSLFTLYLWRWF